MRSKIEDYNAVVEAASKFTKSVAEGNSKYAKELAMNSRHASTCWSWKRRWP